MKVFAPIEIYYLGTVALSQAALLFYKTRGGDYVVSVLIKEKYGSPFLLTDAVKHAQQRFFNVMRMKHQKDNIYFTMIYPGFVRTSIAMNKLRGDGSLLGVKDRPH